MQTKSGARSRRAPAFLFVQNVFGIWDNEFWFCRSSLINNNPPPLPVMLHFALLCCYCQACGSFSGSIIETHICSRCDLACVLSDDRLDEKLIIGSKRKVQRGKCLESSSSPPPPQHIALSLQSHVRAGRDPFERD